MGAFIARSTVGGFSNANLTRDFDEFSGVIGGYPPTTFSASAAAVAARSPALPVYANAQARAAIMTRSFKDDFYNRLYVTPEAIGFGNVGTPKTETVTVWNAYLEPQTLTSLTNTVEGLTVDGLAPPEVFPALAERTWTLTISADGPIAISGAVSWSFSGETVTIQVTGTRVVVWPFAPLSTVIESVEWLTDVVQTYSGEDRYSIRATPLRELQLSHTASHELQAIARTAARGPGNFLIPDWTNIVTTSASTGAPVALPDGGVFVWRSPTDYEQSSVTSGVLGTVLTAGIARVMPMLTARASADWANSRPAGKWSGMSITFQTADGQTDSATTRFTSYLGLPLMTDPVQIGSGTSGEGVTWEAETVNNEVGVPVDLRTTGYPAETYLVSWQVKGADYTDLRKWLYSRKGKFAAFWLPSWAADIPSPTRSGVTIQTTHYDEDEAHILAHIGGDLYPREVTSASRSGKIWALTFDEPLPSGEIKKIMYLRRVRFNADRIEFNHSIAGVGITVACIGVPE